MFFCFVLGAAVASMMRQKSDGEAIFDGVHHQCSTTVCTRRILFFAVWFESQGSNTASSFFYPRGNSAVRRQDRANCDRMTFFWEVWRPIQKTNEKKSLQSSIVFFSLTDRASTIPSDLRGSQSCTWSAGQEKVQRNFNKAPTRA